MVVKYNYDAYGNNLGISGTLASSIGQLNPFRYKGYYFDSETNYFYCKSRYYNPQWGRWLSPDSIQYLEQGGLNGLNLYAYCNNLTTSIKFYIISKNTITKYIYLKKIPNNVLVDISVNNHNKTNVSIKFDENNVNGIDFSTEDDKSSDNEESYLLGLLEEIYHNLDEDIVTNSGPNLQGMLSLGGAGGQFAYDDGDDLILLLIGIGLY